MTSPLTCWVISDGRRGIENQALGLAEALGRIEPIEIISRHISRDGWIAKIPPKFQYWLGRKVEADGPHPHIAIGCGRQSIAPLLRLRKSGSFTVYVQHPRIDVRAFDVVIAPHHDKLSGDNVLSIIGSPNRITPERLEQDKDMISIPDGPVVAWLIGGNSGTMKLDDAAHRVHRNILTKLLEQNTTVLVTMSRRSPQYVRDFYNHLGQEHKNCHVYDDGPDNPYFAYLHHADEIYVTEESTNMLTEACATGKPVFRLPMSGRPKKFQSLYDQLEERCGVVSALSDKNSTEKYRPLNETARAAHFVWEMYNKPV